MKLRLNRQVLASLMVIGMIAAAAGSSTLAYFSDTEASQDNTFAAGAIDFKLDWNESYNGVDIEEQLFTDNPGPIFNLDDVKPGDYGEATISLHNYHNPAWLWMKMDLTKNDDNGNTEPELDVDEADSDSMFDGELAQQIQVNLWYDDGDNIHQDDEPQIFTGETCELVDLDMALALDRSGSMYNQANKFENAKEGGHILVNSLSPTDQGALVSFAGGVTVDETLTTDKSALNSSIDSLVASGSTNIGGAIDAAHNELINGGNARAGAQKVLVLLSNGNPNTGPDAVTEADEAKDDGIRIITIAYGSNANAAILADVASPGDDYTASLTDVEDIFTQISEEVCTLTTLEDVAGALEDGILLDADTDAEGVQGYVNSTTRYLGFSWELPLEVGNDVQTDVAMFDLSFYAEQTRHNPTPQNPWMTPS